MNLTLGFLVSVVVGLATSLGAIPAFFCKNYSESLTDSLLGFAGGVMLAMTTFNLLLPAIASGGTWATIAGLTLGALFIALVDRFVPHKHLISGLEGASSRLSSAWLILFAIAIHNFPEGLAVGVSLGRSYNVTGAAVAIAMGLHNIPEGLACALPLACTGYSRKKVLWYTTLAGLVTPIGGFVGASAVALAEAILPYGLAFAGGAMLYIVFDEMIPQSHRNGHEFEATLCGLVGFALMIIINSFLA